MFRPRIAILIAVAFLAVPAVAQDSTAIDSGVNGLPGDAVSPWDTTEQLNNYVVDLVPFNASWGTEFLIAPIIKTSKTTTSAGLDEYFSSLWSAQAISNHLMLEKEFAFDGYWLWDQPEYGVNNDITKNIPPLTLEDTSELVGNRFGAVFAEYSTTDVEEEYGGIIGGVVDYLPDEPERLYVARIVAAISGATPEQDCSSFGVGGVDGDGDTHFRADDYNTTCPTALTGNNYFRVRMLDRTFAMLNVIDNNGGTDTNPPVVPGATDWLLQDLDPDNVYNTPSIIPKSIAGRPILIGSNFNTEYVREANPYPAALTKDNTHLAAGVTDHRGNVAYSQHDHPGIFQGTVNGTAGILGYDANDLARILNLFGLDANGNPLAPLALTLPVVVIDNSTGWQNTDPYGDDGTQNEFDHYHSQVAFRGGNGQVAIGKDQAGRLLAAAEVDYPANYDPNWDSNYIAVCRYDGINPPEWTIAGYNDFRAGFDGKHILDGPGGSKIGEMVVLNEVTGGTPWGPSVSAPMIDSVGNVWFLSACALDKVDSQGQPYIDYDACLLRAVYYPDAVPFKYELELVLEVGDVFHGQNSNIDYQVNFMGIADSDSVDSGTMWSGNMIQQACNGMDASDLATSDAETLGGLVLCAEIVYDVGTPGGGPPDGLFTKVTGIYGDPTSHDQEYNVMLYIGSRPQEAECCTTCMGDMKPDCDGIVNVTDFTVFALAFPSTSADPNYDICADVAPAGGDGFVNITDFTAWAVNFPGPCP